ncbi:pyruvate:ferredoxin (flavodoxin) oxidoreductase [Sedimenticola hydrogenitrophicus]|uniref:pyruvate:ferredoxin (flavodoxin) oxidoreductase n=1 Tax=Sedimenticola hydrogenitrophicus TaxID=2967975 RepID=UPI0021A3FC59|nr:pyruvate:ferredoxin (flavodoxin) oxidoreductase [Sedimenticola hydrogenitrophicus]
MQHLATIDGNEAAATIAHLTNEVIAIYPITPASPMGEHADAWSAQGRRNLWGTVPGIIEMQSEGGAAGALHGALQAGALCTSFTASQGLLLMIPNLYKIAAELTPMVLHVASRSLAAQALSIFCDHADVMATRGTGFAMLCANSVQEVHDLALIAQAATLEARVPIIHFFDGFRTSHEVAKIETIGTEVVRALISDELVQAHRARALNPEHPVLRGSSQNPDVYFQGRESVNSWYRKMPAIVQGVMDRFAALSGRQYRLFDYVGAADAERVLVLMGSGAETAHETVDHLLARGEKVGLLKVRLYRPFDAAALLATLPATVRRIAVLDRTKEPGADGEPLYKDVLGAVAYAFAAGESPLGQLPLVIGGRYGLSSKEFTPGMVKAVFDELDRERPKNGFTIGIHDDVTHTSLDWDAGFRSDAAGEVNCALFYGLGSDGTVSANKNSIRIIGEATDLQAQGYFEYDSRKAGAVTISHLRFGKQPIRSSYLIGDDQARFIGCHQTIFLERYDLLDKAVAGAVFLLNTTAVPETACDTLPRRMQQQIIDKQLRFFVIDAYRVAQESGMQRRINTIMQTCHFAISGLLPRDQAIQAIKDAVEKSYGGKGDRIVELNFRAIDAALANLHQVSVPERATSTFERPPAVAANAPPFVREVTARLIAGQGDRLPVSAMPADGTWPTATTRWEKRNIALEIPVWDENLCIACGKCPFVCPHTAIRSKLFDPARVSDLPPTFRHMPVKGKEFPEGAHIVYQVAAEDCTGCGLCVDICPAKDKENPGRRALNMAPQPPLREQERVNFEYFLALPEFDRREVRNTVMKSAMLLQPLFEFSSACPGCGETPYLRLASQLFGDRMLVANATGCSSIYGGNLPTTPWARDTQGRGPAWNNSLFEDNAEFGLGMRIAVDKQREQAIELLDRLASHIDAALMRGLLDAGQGDEAGIHEQRERVARLREALQPLDLPEARQMESLTDSLVKRSVWIVGGDGWAYDIGFGGLDHVLSCGRDVNILVLDTEVYSNTGGQTSKATPRGAVAKFSAGGKPTAKKDLAMIAMAYGDVYVAQVAYGAKDVQTLKAFMEAESWPGVSLIIAYSPCTAWGTDMANNHAMQDRAVRSGHWPLFRYDPRRAASQENPLQLDSREPSIAYRDFVSQETRFSMLWRSDPEAAERYLGAAQQHALDNYLHYRQLADLSYATPGAEKPGQAKE